MDNEVPKFCTNCGSKLKDGADFCLKCGKSVVNHSSPTYPKPSKNDFPWWGIILISVIGIFVGLIFLCIFLGMVIYDDVTNEVTNPIEEFFNDINEGTIGDTLIYDDTFKITLDKALIYDKIESNSAIDNPSKGHEYLILYLTVHNISDELESFNYHYNSGYVDNVKVENAKILFNQPDNLDIMNGNIEPGVIKRGYVAFEVPIGFETFNYIYCSDDGEYVEFMISGSGNNSAYGDKKKLLLGV